MRRLFSKRQKRTMQLIHGNLCAACGKPLDHNFHGDHVKPLSKGGKTILKNAQPLCPKCNLEKGASYGNT